jgi:hypothetical protein
VNYRKIDAPLAAVLHQTPTADEGPFEVFIHTEGFPGPAEAEVLEHNGVRGGTMGRRIFTATLSRDAIDGLSEQPWIRSLRLAAQLRPVGKK